MKTSDIHIRDPFILPWEGRYYLYGTRGPTCWGKADGFDVYVSTDLQNWSAPIEIFHNDGTFWADQNYWAPEVHFYKGSFYLFATFFSEKRCRGTQILRSHCPTGPFVPISDGPITPENWECLDGTFFVSQDGMPYLVFCHEWLQIHDGTICAVPLSQDLTHTTGVPRVLFHASEAAPWVRPLPIPPAQEAGCNYVTDGPFFYRSSNQKLYLLWSSYGAEGYTQALAVSDNDDITGNWKPLPTLLFPKNGGHGMIFRGFDGILRLVLHAPNDTPLERPVFFPIEENADGLTVQSNS